MRAGQTKRVAVLSPRANNAKGGKNMPLEIIECEQRSEAWRISRLGIPTASMFSTVMASGRGGGPSKTRATYMRKLAGEIITGEPMENFPSPAMDRGTIMENEARSFYTLMTDTEPETVGFIRNGDKGASPDALIGDDGLLEIKTSRADLLIDIILKDAAPPEHLAQCQGQLWVAEREWLDLVIYWPGMPFFCKRIERDEEYISDLSREVDLFNTELAHMVAVIKEYRGAVQC